MTGMNPYTRSPFAESRGPEKAGQPTRRQGGVRVAEQENATSVDDLIEGMHRPILKADEQRVRTVRIPAFDILPHGGTPCWPGSSRAKCRRFGISKHFVIPHP